MKVGKISSMQYPIFICDDDPNSIMQISKILGAAEIILSDDDTQENKVEFKIILSSSYDDANKSLKKEKISGGIYFLDIELGKDKNTNNGFDLAESIEKQDERAQIIFITTHSDMSLVSFERRLGPIDYIVKTSNIDKLRERIVKTVEIAIHKLHEFNYMKKMTFSYKIGRIVKNINIDDVVYITTTFTPHKLLLIKTSGESQFLGSINEYAQENPMLEKISQSCLANPKNIKSIDLHDRLVSFVNGKVESFSESNISKMKKLLGSYNYKVEQLTRESN